MSKRETTEILGNVFTYTEALVSLAMQRKRPELLADARELKYAGTSRLNKRDLAIMLVDAHIAEQDHRAADDFTNACALLNQATAGDRTEEINMDRATAIELDEKRTIARAYGSVPSDVVLSWEEIEGLYSAAMLRRERELDELSAVRGAFRLRSGDTVYTTTDRDAQPSFAGGWATKIYMDDAYFVITVRFESYGDREKALSDLVKTWRGVSFERGEGNTTFTVHLPHYA